MFQIYRNEWERQRTERDENANEENSREKRIRRTRGMIGKTNLRRENVINGERATARQRISDGRTCFATKNEIGSINATRAGPSLRSLMMRETRREGSERGWGGKVCLHVCVRERERTYSRGARNERDGETTNPRLRHVE